jgi:hypothetical protein
MFNNANPTRVVIATTGTYMLRGLIRFNDSVTYNQNAIRMRKNGTTYLKIGTKDFSSWHNCTTSGQRCCQSLCKANLAAGDYVELMALIVPAGVNNQSVVWLYFSVQRVA